MSLDVDEILEDIQSFNDEEINEDIDISDLGGFYKFIFLFLNII